MEESISSSTNQSPTGEGIPLKENLPKPSGTGMSLLDIPVLRPSTIQRVSQSQDIPFTAPSSYDDGKVVYEYEFTCIYTDTRPMFIGLWDTDDLSACQRVSACVIDREEIVYDKETGIGFFKTVDGLRWCFKKEVYERSIGPINPIGVGDLDEIKTKSRVIRHTSADDILASL